MTERSFVIAGVVPCKPTTDADTLSFARSKGAYVTAITDSMFSPIAELADSVLVARSDMASFADSLAAPLSLINALIVGAGLRRKDEVYERLDQLEGIWKSHKVYIASNTDDRDNE